MMSGPSAIVKNPLAFFIERQPSSISDPLRGDIAGFHFRPNDARQELDEGADHRAPYASSPVGGRDRPGDLRLPVLVVCSTRAHLFTAQLGNEQLPAWVREGRTEPGEVLIPGDRFRRVAHAPCQLVVAPLEQVVGVVKGRGSEGDSHGLSVDEVGIPSLIAKMFEERGL